MPQAKRLSRSAFPSVLAKGRRVSSASFSVVFSKEGLGYGVVVSKKVARLSVTRHRIKRRVVEALRTLQLPPSAVVFFPKAAVAQMSHKDVSTELATLLSKIP